MIMKRSLYFFVTWFPFFSPLGYGCRFDSFVSVLASLYGVVDSSRQKAVDRYISEISRDKRHKVLPVFYPQGMRTGRNCT